MRIGLPRFKQEFATETRALSVRVRYPVNISDFLHLAFPRLFPGQRENCVNLQHWHVAYLTEPESVMWSSVPRTAY